MATSLLSLVTLGAVGLATAACAPRTPGAVTHHALVGQWYLATRPPPRATPGIRLTLTVDSGTTQAFFGRLSSYMAGNVGVDPTLFQPFRGTLSGDSVVNIVVEPDRADAPRMQFTGQLARDTVRLETFAIGRDTLTEGSRGWLLVRRP